MARSRHASGCSPRGCLENRVAELHARRAFPDTATTNSTVAQGGITLSLEEVVSATPNPTIRRVDIAASQARDPGRVLARLTAYVSQTQ